MRTASRGPCWAIYLGLFVWGVLTAESADAAVYKYRSKNGTVVYTDRIGDLPGDRQKHYMQQEARRKADRDQLERAIGRDELARRDARKKKAKILKAKMKERQRIQQLAEINAVLQRLRKRSAAQDQNKGEWQSRMKTAKLALKKDLEDFAAAREKYNAIATKASFTLLPGQRAEMEKNKATMSQLETKIDAGIVQVEQTIPTEARRAGIPPGWLRDL